MMTLRRFRPVAESICWLLLLSVLMSCRSTATSDPGAREPSQKDTSEGEISGASEGSASREADAAFAALLRRLGVIYRPELDLLEISGVVNMQEGLVEVFACAPDGKTHEAIVVLDCVPSGLHAGLLALGLEPGSPVETGTQADYRPPTGPGVIVEVRWRASDGSKREARAEDWVWDRARETTMPRVS